MVPYDAVTTALRRVADGLLSVLLAPVCAACGKPLEYPTRGAVCDACWGAIVPVTPPLCDQCGDALASWRATSREQARCPRCRRGGAQIARSRAIGLYDGSLRAIVHALKYDGRRMLARPLGQRLAAAGADLLRGADIAVPVPLHRSRRRARGFNQAEEIARHLGLPVVPALRRVRATSSQTDLPAARRHANVRGAVAVVRAARIHGSVVVLVDDVCTTGATLEACAQVLREAGAREIRALTAARAALRPR